MQALRQMSGGVLIAIVSIVLVLGGLSLALAEQTPAVIHPTSTPIVIIFDTVTPSIPTASSTTAVQQDTPIPDTSTPVIIPTSTNTFPPPPVSCAPPPGWVPITVTADNTLDSLAQKYKTTAAELIAKNCLTSAQVPVGYILYVPYIPPTAIAHTAVPCTHPIGWMQYTVQSGDNLFRIASSVNLTYTQLQKANCLTTTNIFVGQKLWVPYLPPTATIGSIIFPTITDTNTSIPPTNTEIPTNTVAPIDTTAPTLAPTNTTAPQPTATLTPFPTKTP